MSVSGSRFFHTPSSLCQIIDIVSEDYSFRVILVKGKSTAVKIQSSSEHQVKFSKLLPALFSFGHSAGPYIMETARKGWAVLNIFRVGGIHF